MKKIKMAKAFGLADEKYVAEAAPSAANKGIFNRFTLIAACITLAFIFCALALFMPFGKLTEAFYDTDILPSELHPYKNSEYIGVINALYEYEKQIELSSRPNTLLEEAVDSSLNNRNSYIETTDNQVEGIVEADLFKRTSSHVFYLDQKNNKIMVYSIKGEASSLRAEYKIDLNSDIVEYNRRVKAEGIFLSEDGKTLTVLGHCSGIYEKDNEFVKHHSSFLLSLDVSNIRNIKEKATFYINGLINSARMTNGKILLMTNHDIDAVDYSDESSFIPQISYGASYESISADEIIFPKELTSKHYTVVTQLDMETLERKGSAACLSYGGDIYVSRDKLFLYRYVTENEKGDEYESHITATEILALEYGDEGFNKIGSITVEGRIRNQYSFDEYEGVLRAVATTGGVKYAGRKGIIADNRTRIPIQSNAALYCIDIESMKIIAQVKDFAPWGEGVQSVRFDETKAYVCTAEVATFSDPVYFFDLSDMNNITYTDTGTIEGYSSSLVDFGEGYLLGIGFGNSDNTLKIEIYEERNGKVESVCMYERSSVYFSSKYKSYFIDREQGLVGLAYLDDTKESEEYKYVLLRFNGEEFVELIDKEFEKIAYSVFRALLIDEVFYIFAGNIFHVEKVILN